MNVQLDLRMDVPDFLVWAQAHEGRYELVGGRVVMMTGGSRGHVIVVRRLAAALEARLDVEKWTVLTLELAVALGPGTVRYPDVMVDVAGGDLEDLTATTPMLIAEVLSPSSVKNDLHIKAAEYMQLPSLSAYLVLAQDEPKAWIWLRDVDGFPNEPVVVRGLGERIEIAAHGIDLSLSEIYAGLF